MRKPITWSSRSDPRDPATNACEPPPGGDYTPFLNPDGLRGVEIPIGARVLAVIDCYDALTTVRPYKGAWSHAEAFAHLKAERGKAFDPDLVDAFLASEAEVLRCLELGAPASRTG